MERSSRSTSWSSRRGGIISDEFCATYPCRVINIHHSFLLAFIGSKPYHRAHERGVKFIGATAHYATKNLDEGPIIEQGTTRLAPRHGRRPAAEGPRRRRASRSLAALRAHLDDRGSSSTATRRSSSPSCHLPVHIRAFRAWLFGDLARRGGRAPARVARHTPTHRHYTHEGAAEAPNRPPPPPHPLQAQPPAPLQTRASTWGATSCVFYSCPGRSERAAA